MLLMAALVVVLKGKRPASPTDRPDSSLAWLPIGCLAIERSTAPFINSLISLVSAVGLEPTTY